VRSTEQGYLSTPFGGDVLFFLWVLKQITPLMPLVARHVITP
jgi:hypothetical protein